MKDNCITGNEDLEIRNLKMLFVYRKKSINEKRVRTMEMLIYVIRGRVQISDIDGKYDYIGEAGDVIYLPNGEVNTTSYLEESNKILIIKFNSDTDRILGGPMLIKKGSSEEISATADNMVKQLTEHRDRDHTYFCMLTYKFIYKIRHYNKKQVQYKFHKLFPVIAQLRAHPEADCKIQDYADMCSMSEVGFRKLFMEYTGKTPVEYRTELRLNMAVDMLLDGEYSVSEAAKRAGFNSTSFFCREFKKYYGYSAGNIGKEN